MNGTPGYYLGPSMLHYRTHRCLSSHTGRERYADTVAWFPELLTPPTKPSADEALHAAILDLQQLLKRYLRTDVASTLPAVSSILADIEDLALMYNPAEPATAAEQRVSILPDPGVPKLQSISADTRVLLTLASPAPVAIDLQRPNSPLHAQVPPTIPFPPHPHRTRSSTAATRLAMPHPAYEATLLGDNGFLNPPSPTAMRDSTWVPEITHIAPFNSPNIAFTDPIAAAFAAQPALNLNADGSPLTYSTAKKGPNTTHWQDAEDTEISRLIDSVVMHARYPHEQPADRKKDTTYYNPQTKEKDTDSGKTYRIRGTIGGDRINYTGVTKANTAAMPVVKMLLQSVVSDDAEFMTIDIKDFYLNTELPRSEWMRIPVKFLSAAILEKHNLRPFINDGAVIFEVVKSLYGLPHAG